MQDLHNAPKYAHCLFEAVARDLKHHLGDRALDLAECAALHACNSKDEEAAAMWHAIHQALLNIAPLFESPATIH